MIGAVSCYIKSHVHALIKNAALYQTKQMKRIITQTYNISVCIVTKIKHPLNNFIRCNYYVCILM